jgi:hypothetical protein
MQSSKLGYLIAGAGLGFLLHAYFKRRDDNGAKEEPAPRAPDNVVQLAAWRRHRTPGLNSALPASE